MSTNSKSRAIPFAVACAVAMVPAAVFAQADSTKTKSGELEEVTVTAQRFTGTLQTTPIAISAFSAESLEQKQLTSVLEAASQIPGVMMTSTTGATSGARIFMRGIGQENTAILFDPAVGVYVDNVYQPRINGQFFDFFDIERLEVLRGPQGTLYGRNSDGGAIKIISRKPSYDWTVSGDMAFGNYAQNDARLYASGPIIADKLAFSVSGVSRKRDGWTVNPNYDRAINNKNQQGYRLKLLFTPNDKFEAEMGYQYLRDRSDAGMGSQIQLLGNPTAVVNPKAVPGRNLFESELSGPQFNQGNIEGIALNMSYKLTPNLAITSTTGWGLQRVNLATNFVQTATALSIGTSYRYTDSFLSQEVNLTAKYDKFKGSAGVYYFTETGHQSDVAPYTSAAAQNNRERKTDASAVFAEGTYYVTENVGLTAGIRYTEEKADFTQFYFNQVGRTPQNAKKTFKSTTPKFGIDWQVMPNTMLYASYTKGFKSGGFNAVNPTTNIGGPPGTVAGPTPYDPEKVTSYEAGVKFTSEDRRVRVNLAVFQADYDGVQLPVFFPGTANSFTSNAASAKVRGIEIEPTWRINDSFQIYAMGSFETNKYTSPFQCSLYNTTIVNCQNAKLKGSIPTKTSVGFEFSPQLHIKGGITFNGGWDHHSAYFNNVSNTLPIVQTPKADLFNASVRWDSDDGHWRVALEGKNLANKAYALETLQIASPTQPSLTVYPNDPRTYDLRIRFNF